MLSHTLYDLLSEIEVKLENSRPDENVTDKYIEDELPDIDILDPEEDEDTTLDPEELPSSQVSEAESHDAMMRRYEEYFAQYKRARDVSAKIIDDMDYDINALIKRRVKNIPPSIPFGMSDIFSAKEIAAIMNHANYKLLDRTLQDAFFSSLEEAASDISSEIDNVLIDAFLSETKVLKKSLASEAAYRAGMATHAEGVFRLSELGQRHSRDLLKQRMSGEQGLNNA